MLRPGRSLGMTGEGTFPGGSPWWWKSNFGSLGVSREKLQILLNPSSVRSGCRRGQGSLSSARQCINSLTSILPWRRLLPPHPSPLPHWGRGDKMEPIQGSMVIKPDYLTYSLSPRFGGRGLGGGGRRSACNFLTGHRCLNPLFSKGDYTPCPWQEGEQGNFPSARGKLWWFMDIYRESHRQGRFTNRPDEGPHNSG
jgi:hypothetical protein